MMYRSTQLIERYFVEHDIHCSVDENDKFSYVSAGLASKTASSLTVRFISDSNDHNSVSVRVLSMAECPADKRAEMLEFINDVNNRFRFLRLVLTKTNSINAEYDLPNTTENVGEECREIFIRFSQIIDEFYRDMMKLVWGF